MDYLKFVANYYFGTKEFVGFMLNNLYEINNPNYITEKRFLCAAKMGAISNIFLSIKENIVENTGNLNYESKLYNDSLEKSVSIISEKTASGYMIDNYEFKDASTLVATLRNKIAHGDFLIDFDKEEVIINVENTNISIDINKLSKFIITSLRNNFFYTKTKNYSRNITVNEISKDKKPKKITSTEEIKHVINNCTNINFNLSREDNNFLEKYEIDKFNKKLNTLKNTTNMDFNSIQNLRKEYKENGYILKADYYKMNKYKSIMELIPLIQNTILTQERYTYDNQISTITNEVQRKIESSYNEFNPLLANLTNLYIIEEISKSGSTNLNSIVDSLAKKYGGSFYINYDNLVASLISVFNSLFSIPLEKIYKNNDGKGLDFSKLKFDDNSIIKNDNNDSFYSEIDTKLKSLNKRLLTLIARYNNNLNNYCNISQAKNQKAKATIKNNLIKICNDMETIKKDIKNLENKLKYYNNRELYIKNKSIIEGIRNSISHGNYKVMPGETFQDSKIIFSDIYEGKLTFKAEFTILKFMELFNNNIDILDKYFDEIEDNLKKRN